MSKPSIPDFASAKLWPKGNLFEDFQPGQTFHHHWGRTISEADALQFAWLTQAYTPQYFNRDYAKALGHKDIVVAPLLVFNIIFGMTVEDCSEIGGPFLGVHNLHFLRDVYPGDTLWAQSETLACRPSKSNPDNGIVSWRTQGFRGDEPVIDYERTNLIRLRHPKADRR